jgi:EmrB/QacA subfamily drug resistance transporter
MRTPCDEALIRSSGTAAPCEEEARNWILAATILASSMAFIDSTVVNVALPALQASFHATVVDVQWVVESYGLLLSALILTGGSLGDLFGRRRIFLLGVAIFAIASAGCGAALSIRQLIIARSVQGVGAALLVPGSLAIVSSSFDQKSRGQAIGTWSGFTAITTAIGPVLGGWVLQHYSWRWVFFINLPLAIAVVTISIWQIPKIESGSTEHVDWRGALLGTVGLGGLVGGFIESVNLGWRNDVVLALLIVGIVALSAFAWVEAKASAPMFPLKLFASQNFSGANLLTLLLYAALGIFFFVFPLNLIQVQEYSTTAAGSALLPFILLMFFLSRWSGGLVARYGPKAPLVLGPLQAGLGFALFALPSIGNCYWETFFPALLVLGFGMAVTVAPLTTVVMNSVDQDRVGAASGVNNAVARVAGVLAVAVLGIVMVKAFGWRLNQAMSHLAVPPQVLQGLQRDEIKLAGIRAPESLDPQTKAAVKQSIGAAFVFGFRIIMLICVGLSVASAAVAGAMIRQERVPSAS